MITDIVIISISSHSFLVLNLFVLFPTSYIQKFLIFLYDNSSQLASFWSDKNIDFLLLRSYSCVTGHCHVRVFRKENYYEFLRTHNFRLYWVIRHFHFFCNFNHRYCNFHKNLEAKFKNDRRFYSSQHRYLSCQYIYKKCFLLSCSQKFWSKQCFYWIIHIRLWFKKHQQCSTLQSIWQHRRPSQTNKCVIDLNKVLEQTHEINFHVTYHSGTHKYQDTICVKLDSRIGNFVNHNTSKDKEVAIISETLQDAYISSL